MRLTRRRRQVLAYLIACGAVAVVLLLVYAILTSATKSTEIRDTQESRTEQVESNDQTLRIIRNCTTPGRACYERGQRQLATAVSDVNRVVVLAAACASGPVTKTEAEIQTCVLKRLKPRR